METSCISKSFNEQMVQPVSYFLIRGYEDFHDGDEWIGIYDSLPELKLAYKEAIRELEGEHKRFDENDSWTSRHEKVMINAFNKATGKWKYDIPYTVLFPETEESGCEEYKTVKYIIDHPDMFVFKQQAILQGKQGEYIYDEELLKIKRPTDEVIQVKFKVKNSYEIFAALGEWWGGWNNCPDWRTMRDKAREWYDKYGAELKEISHDTLVFACRSLSEDEVNILWDDICQFAPGCRDIAADENNAQKRLMLNKEFALWWD